MSALGQKPTYAVRKGMSALPPKADMCGALVDVCYGPKADVKLFNHLVGAADECLRYRQAKFFGGLQIDDKLDLVGLLDGKLGGLFALENPAGVNPDPPIHIGGAGAVTHEAATDSKFALMKDRWHPKPRRQGHDLDTPGIEERIGGHHQGADALFVEGSEGGVDFVLAGCGHES